MRQSEVRCLVGPRSVVPMATCCQYSLFGTQGVSGAHIRVTSFLVSLSLVPCALSLFRYQYVHKVLETHLGHNI